MMTRAINQLSVLVHTGGWERGRMHGKGTYYYHDEAKTAPGDKTNPFDGGNVAALRIWKKTLSKPYNYEDRSRIMCIRWESIHTCLIIDTTTSLEAHEYCSRKA